HGLVGSAALFLRLSRRCVRGAPACVALGEAVGEAYEQDGGCGGHGARSLQALLERDAALAELDVAAAEPAVAEPGAVALADACGDALQAELPVADGRSANLALGGGLFVKRSVRSLHTGIKHTTAALVSGSGRKSQTFNL